MILGKRQDLIKSLWYRIVLVLRALVLAISGLLLLVVLIKTLATATLKPTDLLMELALSLLILVPWLILEKTILFVVTGSARLSTQNWFNMRPYRFFILAFVLVPPLLTAVLHDKMKESDLVIHIHNLKNGQTQFPRSIFLKVNCAYPKKKARLSSTTGVCRVTMS